MEKKVKKKDDFFFLTGFDTLISNYSNNIKETRNRLYLWEKKGKSQPLV